MKLPDYPVHAALPALHRALAQAGRAVLAAPPGSGKTTLVPLAVLDADWLNHRRIVMLEPRRVAARAAAARMAQLLGERVGETVGYQVRFERRISERTRIEVLTEGLLSRRLQADPELPGVGLVIFDEFHERSLDADLALALTLDARTQLNPELRVLVMSATLDTQAVARLLQDAPIVQAGGRIYPVELRYRPQPAARRLGEAVAEVVVEALRDTQGDVLAFLPGAREIREAQARLEGRQGLAVYPLYGELASEAQDAALRPDPQGRRKAILATNIAQTSLTVEGVCAVVDGGWQRAARFDLGAGANRLETLRVSRAAAEQRAGRAGRLGPGLAYRLWSQDQQGALAAQDTPEILAADLSRFALELAAWGVRDPAQLAFLDPPPVAGWKYAVELLGSLGALDGERRITRQGRWLLRMPTSPRLGRLLNLARERGTLELAAWTAAALEEREAEGGSDLERRVAALREGRGEPAQRRRVRESVAQFLRLARAGETGSPADVAEEAQTLAVLTSQAFPERIARRRAGVRGTHEVAYLCADGSEARLPESDPLARSEWLAIAHWDPGSSRRIRLAAAITEDRVRAEHGSRILCRPEVYWDAQRQAVVAEEQERLGAIVLGARRLAEPGEASREAMLEGIRSLGLSCLPWSESARQWQARVLSLRQWQPEAGWPDVSDEALLAGLADWLGPYLDGITRREHLQTLDLLAILGDRLDFEAQKRLSKLAPSHLTVPSGLRHPLRYEPPGSPALEVKLQEMFGCQETPTVCEGRVRVVLHLLSPAQRPVAVTQDLSGFWSRGYAEVKKDLRGRYPRHPWPDDPRVAAPTARAKPRN